MTETESYDEVAKQIKELELAVRCLQREISRLEEIINDETGEGLR